MAKWCFNYESGEYEYIGEYVYNWDDSEYRREEFSCDLLFYDEATKTITISK